MQSKCVKSIRLLYHKILEGEHKCLLNVPGMLKERMKDELNEGRRKERKCLSSCVHDLLNIDLYELCHCFASLHIMAILTYVISLPSDLSIQACCYTTANVFHHSLSLLIQSALTVFKNRFVMHKPSVC